VKLFGRLLLWFLAANLITAVVALLFGQWFVNFAYTQADAERDGRAAIAIYEHEGADGLWRWLQEQLRTGNVAGMLLDADDRPLAQPRPPPLPPDAPAADGPPAEFHLEIAPPRDEDFFGDVLGFLLRDGPPGFTAQMRSAAFTTSKGAHYRWIGAKRPPRGEAALRLDALLRLVASLLVIGAAAWLAARRIAAPIRELERASMALAAGNLNARVERAVLARDDELGGLGATFNDMAQRIGKLVDSHKQLLRDVSHELRTPLARLRIAAELAREKGEPRHFERIEEEAEQLTTLIQQVLLLAQLDNMQAHGESPATPFALDELLADVCARARIEAAQRRIEVIGDFPAPSRLRGWPPMLRSAFENILRNALRFAPENSSVLIELAQHPGAYQVSVCDRGPGVPEEALKAIFKPFVRVSSARERDTGGSGLGLSIAEAAVRAHGGSIGAHNRAGGGLCVEVLLPAA
jgi:signal transduction histidine kinase